MEAELGSSYELELHKVPKQRAHSGWTMHHQRQYPYRPAIPPESCYDQYRKGTCLWTRLWQSLTLYRQNDTPPPGLWMLSDYEGIRSNIACKLIHAVSNEAF